MSYIYSVRPRSQFSLVVLLALAVVVVSACDVSEQNLASDWVVRDASKVRLIGGLDKAGGQLVAGVEMQLEPGWKTYWRSLAAGSGKTPKFNFSKSQNLADAVVLYPAPQLFVERSVETIGYKKHVVFPIRVSPVDPAKPVRLAVRIDYGICENLCVPLEASLELALPVAGESGGLPKVLEAALAQVPRSGAAITDDDPRLVSTSAVFDGDKPRIVFEVTNIGDGDKGKLFVAALDGSYVPMATRLSDAVDGSAQFLIDLTAGADVDDFKGAKLRVTAIGPTGQSETMVELD